MKILSFRLLFLLFFISCNGVFAQLTVPQGAGLGMTPLSLVQSRLTGQGITLSNAAVFLFDNTMTDIRDNKQYTTMESGTQCRIAENLNYRTFILSTHPGNTITVTTWRIVFLMADCET